MVHLTDLMNLVSLQEALLNARRDTVYNASPYKAGIG